MDKRTQNEQIFRAANENLKERLARLEQDGRTPFICECDDGDCLQVVDVPLALYEQVRAGDHFLMLPDHDSPDTERVVDGGDGYIVTQKTT